MGEQSLHDRLDAPYAPGWQPSPGAVLVGEIVSIDERTTEYHTYPVLTIRQEDGTEVAFHAFHAVAMGELASLRPVIGERIGIKYRGQVRGENARSQYHSYTIKVDRAAGRGIDWSRYGDEPVRDLASTDGTPVVEPLAPADDGDLPF